MLSQPSTAELEAIVRAEIRSQGRITFHRFMDLCLYHPHHGFYNSEKVRLGKAGDFYTSAHAAPVFARLLARHLELTWEQFGKPPCLELIELGPGDGTLASGILSWTAQRFPEMSLALRYTAVEQSGALRNRLQAALEPSAKKVRLAADWNEIALTGPACVLANEFFDALPIHLLVWRDGGWKEKYVCIKPHGLSWCEADPSSPELARQADSYFDPEVAVSDREQGWVAEIRPRAEEWIERIATSRTGQPHSQLLVIDYGYTIDEWQRGRFPQGSALGYRRHRVMEHLLGHPGDQDLTAHVNFSQLIEAGAKAGMRVRTLEPQSKFLMTLGSDDQFEDVFAGCASEQERLQRSSLLKTLVMPQGMGETFRVLVMDMMDAR